MSFGMQYTFFFYFNLNLFFNFEKLYHLKAQKTVNSYNQ